LVEGNQAAVLSSSTDTQGNTQLQSRMGQTSSTLSTAMGGQLGALYDYQQQVLSPLQTQVTGLMQSVSEQVNTTLASGYDLQGDQGKALFTVSTDSAGVARLATTDLTPAQLGLSLDKTTPANGGNLTTLSGLQTTSGVTEQATAITSHLALANSQSSNQLAVATAVNQQWQEQRDNLSAVNKDEEAVNLQTYLQSYQANMKVMSVGNQLFSELLTLFS